VRVDLSGLGWDVQGELLRSRDGAQKEELETSDGSVWSFRYWVSGKRNEISVLSRRWESPR
jgi:hypothetical protein